MRRLVLLLLASCAAPAAGAPPAVCPPAPARPPTTLQAPSATLAKLPPERSLERILTAPSARPGWFAKAFLDKVSAAKVTDLVEQLRRELGAFQRVEKGDPGYRAVFANGVVPARIHLDGEGRIDGLFFGPAERTHPRPLAEILGELEALPGKVSALVTTSGKPEGEIAPDAKLAVGSAFKLAILAVLKEQVEAKRLTWTQLVRLDPKHKSLPSGILQDWPNGAPLTLYSVASLMIARSDNTATDLALALAGRAAVEALAPGNAPLLSTRQAFILKSKKNAEMLARWRSSDEADRRKMLVELDDAPRPDVDDLLDDGLMAPDVEWRFSARRLCDLLDKTKDLPMLHINPGVATHKDWDSIAYKGGSEPGVLNLSTLVEKAGRTHCVVATWNADTPVDEDRFFTLYRGLLASLRER